jgi:hypothetical protein
MLCARCLDRTRSPDHLKISDDSIICALCLGILQDHVIDPIIEQVPSKISSYSLWNGRKITAKISISLPVSIAIRDFAFSVHMQENSAAWTNVKDLGKKLIAEKLNLILGMDHFEPFNDVNQVFKAL